MENLSKRLSDKSIEAFIMGLEIYNKPTIRYRIEGFSFFICNAWELMLKAYLINRDGETSIYYEDNPDRTITLENSIKLVFTNEKDPLRKNLERIIHLRNTSTHFITEDYERVYAPLFQASVLNYVEKMKEFHGEDITHHIAQNFLTLSVRLENLKDSEIRAKYSKVMAERLIREQNELSGEVLEEGNKFAIPIETNLFITKNKNQADIVVAIDKHSEDSIKIVKEMKNPNNLYPHTTNNVVTLINRKLKAANIVFKKVHQGELIDGTFTTHDFSLFSKFYELKTHDVYSFHYEIANRYGYSPKTIDFIFEEIKKDPENIIQSLKESLKK